MVRATVLSGTRYSSPGFGFFRVYIVALREDSRNRGGQPVACSPCVTTCRRVVSREIEILLHFILLCFVVALTPQTLSTRRAPKRAATPDGPEVEVR